MTFLATQPTEERQAEQLQALGPLTQQVGGPAPLEGLGTATAKGIGRGLLSLYTIAGEAEQQTWGRVREPLVNLLGMGERYQDAQARYERDIQAAMDATRLDPDTTGYAGQLTYGVGSVLVPGVIGTAVGGPVLGAAFAGGSAGASSYYDLTAQGVDPTTARTAAGIEGGITFGSFLLPAGLGLRTATRVATGAGLNVATGIGERMALSAYLEGQGYDELAKRYQAFDGLALATDAILGGAFGALPVSRGTHVRPPQAEIDAALVNNAVRHAEIDLAPGIPANGAARAANIRAQETAVRQLLDGEPVTAHAAEAEFLPKPANPAFDDAAMLRAFRESELPGLLDDIDGLERALAARGRVLGDEALPELPAARISDAPRYSTKHHGPVPEIKNLPASMFKARDMYETRGVEKSIEESGLSREDWARTVDLSEPVEASIFSDGEIKLVDGHHRVTAAKILGKNVNVDLTAINAKPDALNGLIAKYTQADTKPPALDLTTENRPLRTKVGETSISYHRDADGVALNLIRTPKEARGQGQARAALRSFLAQTDEAGVAVRLTVAEQDATTTAGRLQKFYESEGFKAAGKDDDGAVKMTRAPNAKAPQTEGGTAEAARDHAIDQMTTDAIVDRPDMTLPETVAADLGLRIATVDQTELPSFKRWFGESKVVDAEGKPLVVYHGTRGNFDKFERQPGADFGFHFGSASQAEGRLSGTRYFSTEPGAHPFDSRGESVMPVYLAIENPLRVTDAGFFDGDNEGFIGELRDQGVPVRNAATPAEITAALEKAGYDGLVYANEATLSEGGGDSWVALRAGQIKSATANPGTFDPRNPSVIDAGRVLDAADEFEAKAKQDAKGFEAAVTCFLRGGA